MKCIDSVLILIAEKSHPARGAWIEILVLCSMTLPFASHPARGAWIEISQAAYIGLILMGRTPQGVRGLKYSGRLDIFCEGVSHPARGAWIEMASTSGSWRGTSSRTPQGVRGLKLRRAACFTIGRSSHPARGAWIEIGYTPPASPLLYVAPRKGCVD